MQKKSTHISELNYRAALFDLPGALLREIHQINPRKSATAIATNWAVLFVLIYSYTHWASGSLFWILYVPCIFLIASRIGVIINLLHEASHGFLSKNRKVNNEVARWLMAYPIGVNYYGYAADHAVHHAYAATKKDVPTDIEKYYYTNFRKLNVYLHLLKDLFGITATMVFLGYFSSEREKKVKSRTLGANSKQTAVTFLQLCAVQVVVLGALFQFDVFNYFLLWIVPCVSPHMFLMRVRGIAEHGLNRQLGKEISTPSQSIFFTRSFLSKANTYQFKPLIWLEKLLICSLSINYHHEHHLYPNVPYYHLPKLHEAVYKRVQQANSQAYAKGYLHAAFLNLYQEQENDSGMPGLLRLILRPSSSPQ